MFRHIYLLVLGCTFAGAANQASADYTAPLMFPTIAADFAMAQLNREVLDRKVEEQGRDGTPDALPDADASSSVTLVYASSPQRRRDNLAHFVANTRTGDPEGAARMEQLFASTDVIGRMASILAPYGYSVDNVADAYAFWWMTAWEGSQGSNRTFSRAEMQAVQGQARAALLAAPQLARMGDAGKQKMAEAMWIHAAMIDGMVEMAKQQPKLLPELQQSIRQGARASGLDLDAMRLTPDGFVKR